MKRILFTLGVIALLLASPLPGHTNALTRGAGSSKAGGGGGGPTAPTNISAPVASGTTTVGSVLSTTNGSWTDSPTYTYQWKRNSTNISGATASTYTTVTADGGTSVNCLVTATNAGGSNSQLSNALSITAAVANTVTPIMSWPNGFPSGGTSFVTQNGAVTATTQVGSNSYSSSLTTRRTVLPFAGTIGNIRAHTTVANTGITITDHLGSLGLGTVVCDFSSSGTDCLSSTTQTVAAGTLFQYQFATSIAWASQLFNLGFTYTASGGNHVAILGQTGASGASQGATFAPLLTGLLNGTESAVAMRLCDICGGIIHGFYWIPNVTESAGGQHNLAISINGTPSTIMTATDTAGSAAGACVNDRTPSGTIDNTTACGTVSSITVNAGDWIAIKITCIGTCSFSTLPGFGIDFEPTNPGTIPAFAFAAGTGGPAFGGISDINMNTSQGNYQMVPVGLTISNLSFCSLQSMVAAPNGYTLAVQSGATGAAPTTPGGGPSILLNATTGAAGCPGANPYAYLGGAVDSTHTLSLTAGQTTDLTITRVGSVISTAMRMSAAITVP